MAPDGTKVRFIADDKAELTLALGMLFDATPLLGGPRSKVCRLAVPPCPERVIDTFVR
jgi:peroxiredoxin